MRPIKFSSSFVNLTFQSFTIFQSNFFRNSKISSEINHFTPINIIISFRRQKYIRIKIISNTILRKFRISHNRISIKILLRKMSTFYINISPEIISNMRHNINISSTIKTVIRVVGTFRICNSLT